MREKATSNLTSTRFRTPQHSNYITSVVRDQANQFSSGASNSHFREVYSPDALEEILSNQINSYSKNSPPRQEPHQLTCICPGVSTRDNNIHLYSLVKRNKYLEKKIGAMREIFEKQVRRLHVLSKYKGSHSNCESNCYKERYFELLKNVQPE